MNRTVIVSGGGTGIGRAIAHVFALDSDHVVIVGRREAVLKEAANTRNAGLTRRIASVGRLPTSRTLLR